MQSHVGDNLHTHAHTAHAGTTTSKQQPASSPGAATAEVASLSPCHLLVPQFHGLPAFPSPAAGARWGFGDTELGLSQTKAAGSFCCAVAAPAGKGSFG